MSPARQRSVNAIERRNIVLRFVFAINGMKVWRRVIIPIHANFSLVQGLTRLPKRSYWESYCLFYTLKAEKHELSRLFAFSCCLTTSLTAPGRVRQLRDPAIYREGRQAYIVYSIAGESGPVIAKLVE